ncbi:ATP-binding cassette domain-containing protein [Epidermidibacterium keratini]|uniref:ATP-binding cassette domain-containing protein n=1 Tax=Epidermidibacterium keratini TaxID=1891644 RepID=A0A7L4YNC3_9ACTN|nr:ABC transporter ATP-binding protein [Epidermidibacterium keratini]QHC00542.1 ATP-binding cassette domain-containing protein [Epidermidibacterium keratini]
MSQPSVPAAGRRVLEVTDLSVRTPSYHLLDGVSFSIDGDERVGLIGESGSGKSITSLSIIGLLSGNLEASGSITMQGKQLLGLSESAMSKVRGQDIAMVFQEPMTALNPTMKVGNQIAEAMLIHGTRDSKKAAYDEALALLGQVGLPDPERAARSYPHQLSGGQRQRVVVAIALANDPDLLICDEPTTALDVTVQAQVLDLIKQEVDQHNSALLFITHDLAVVALMCHRVLVLYGGRVVESGTVREVFTDPKHPYTAGLLGSSDLEEVDDEGHLVAIRGSVPPAGKFPEGCVFSTRCDFATEQCATQPPWTDRSGQPLDVPSGNSGYACWHPLPADTTPADPREIARDPRQIARDPREIARDPREIARDPRQIARDPREAAR